MSRNASHGDTYYRDHWAAIEPNRLERYKNMFQWSAAYEALLDTAQIEPGQTVADFGCGPGAMLVEMARRAGAGGQVHGLDINLDFVASAREKAGQRGSQSCRLRPGSQHAGRSRNSGRGGSGREGGRGRNFSGHQSAVHRHRHRLIAAPCPREHRFGGGAADFSN